MRSFVALSLIFLSTSPITLANVTQVELNKAQLTRAADHSGPKSVPVVGNIQIAYTASIGVGNPSTYYNLVIDTGSSNTWVGAGTPYVRTSTSIRTRDKFNITYGSGGVGASGDEYLDQLTVTPELVIANQSIGNATNITGLAGFDGVLGLGPKDLTNGTLSPDVNQTIPTVTDNMASQGLIRHEVVSFYLAPTEGSNFTSARGIMTFGGVDSSLYNGKVKYAPLTKTSPASQYWAIDLNSCIFGNHSICSNTTAIVDTGNSFLLFPNDILSAYVKSIPRAFYNHTLGLVDVPKASLSFVEPLVFTLGHVKITLDRAAQILPRDQNSQVGGDPDRYYAMISFAGDGIQFMTFGLPMLERYYTVFDTENERVGFAETNHTHSTYPW